MQKTSCSKRRSELARASLLGAVCLSGCLYTEADMQLERARVAKLSSALDTLELRIAACETARMEQDERDDKCTRCDGCGKLADDDERAPWSAWEALPPGSDIAVRLGLVKAIDCPVCGGTGRAREAAQ